MMILNTVSNFRNDRKPLGFAHYQTGFIKKSSLLLANRGDLFFDCVAEHINAQLQGYRLSPRKNLKEFVQPGFITNDILTQLNGIELNDMSNLPGLFGELTTAYNVTLPLLREGKPVNLELSLAEAKTR
ncbi:MAG: hypothetical protein P8M72_09555 [Gammaproteobacteria bacterium]|nr:hypothetical protein [Gammaproteobacteria bacterium]